MRATFFAAGLLTLWALVAPANQPQALPTATTTAAPVAAAPAASALGDFRTLSRYPGN